MAPADAPKAITRALEASRDLLNSLAAPVILPRGCVKFLATIGFLLKFEWPRKDFEVGPLPS